VVVEAKSSAPTFNRPKPVMPVQRVRPGQPVERSGMKSQIAIIENQRALQKKQSVLRKQEDDIEEDLRDTSSDEESVGGSGGSVVLTDEVDELQ
jgi:hypothetical protein